MILGVQVKPNARRTRVVGWADARTVILAVAAPPVEGKANDEVLRFLARALGLPRTALVLVRGAASRTKHVEVPDGVDLAMLQVEGL